MQTSTSAHRIAGEADPLLVVTDGAPGLIAGADRCSSSPDGAPGLRAPGLIRAEMGTITP